ncbi:soyasapogenol B glucuronide galactosyltransferase-like [Arachis duranensis]|uniref:Soyasapogenol B glucuronide galactosyltransferase-like n=1 Tax=Arachis duranensis TaxID=130453 RepID=A0A6P4DVB2_ARADU|nr:soyasapogenol B glucuronide galactosyltransferase-like [Arachis duranensis]
MGTENHLQLNVIFLPYLTPGHMNPMVDTARLFAKHGANVTIITTQTNALTIQKAIDSDFNSGYSIKTYVIQFPSSQLGLPDGVENIKDCTTPQMLEKIFHGIMMLQPQIESVFQELQPDCIVSDMFYPWTVESAAKLRIPRLYYYSASSFSSCVYHFIQKHKPHKGLESDSQKVQIPGLLDKIEIAPTEMDEFQRKENDMTILMNVVYASERRSYGTLCNSFYELEGGYEELYKNTIGIKSWSVGPVSAWINKTDEEKANRGNKVDLKEEPYWLNWLNSKQSDSVLYVSFGSLTRLSYAQIVEIAHGLENSGHNFIWVVRKKGEGDGEGEEECFLQDFEARMKESDKGCIIWNWAPQLLILDHPATGGIVTHCGWNSILESVSSGLPMITWPMFAEQFYNEKFLVQVLKIGVSVGAKVNKFWSIVGEDGIVGREELVKAVKTLMGSEESREMRKRAKKLGDAAKRTIEEGGTSYNNLMQLMDELKSLKMSRN